MKILGEFDYSLTGEYAKEQKRLLFLRELERTAPYVLKKLYDEVFVPFQDCLPDYKTQTETLEDLMNNTAFDELKELAYIKAYSKAYPNANFTDEVARLYEAFQFWHKHYEGIYWYAFLAADDDHYPEMIPIREAILLWADSWNLNSEWFYDYAAYQLLLWKKGRQHNEWYIPRRTILVRINHEEEKSFLPSEDFPRWWPFDQKRKDYLNGLEKELQEHLVKHPGWAAMLKGNFQSHVKDLIKKLCGDIDQKYCEELNLYYERHGYKRTTTETAIEKHIAWTAKIRVLNKGSEISKVFETIAKEEDKTVQAIKKAVKEFLEEIGLSLPPTIGKRGRPSK